MISNLVYTSRSFYISNQVMSKSMYSLLSLDIVGLHSKNFCHLVYALIFIDDKVDIYKREKSQLYLAGHLSLSLQRVLKSSISYNLINKQFIRRLIT